MITLQLVIFIVFCIITLCGVWLPISSARKRDLLVLGVSGNLTGGVLLLFILSMS